MEYISDHQKTIFQALKVAFYNSNTLLNCVFLFYTPLYENEQFESRIIQWRILLFVIDQPLHKLVPFKKVIQLK